MNLDLFEALDLKQKKSDGFQLCWARIQGKN